MTTDRHFLEKGLSEALVLESRRQHGSNVLTPPARRSLWQLYLEKYDDPIVRILLVAAAVSLCLAFVSGQFVETVGIILAVLFATTVGFYFERDAAKKFDVLTQLGEEQAVKVLRDGQVAEIPRRDVVVGDVVLVEAGDEVPADGELLTATALQVDESALTGEPFAEKHAAAFRAAGFSPSEAPAAVRAAGFSPSEAPAAFRAVGFSPSEASPAVRADGFSPSETAAYPPNLLLRSSMVMTGTARMVVTAVGDQTEIGRVAREATELSAVKTPLNLQLDRLAKVISKIGSAVSVVAFVAFLLHDILTNALWHTTDYLSMAEVVLRYFMMAVTLIVMAVPEGLPMAVTLALALNMRRMLQSNNLVRKLQASETMGAVTVICTDKTGTLTQNKMAVSELHELEGSTAAGIFLCIALNSTAHAATDSRSGIGNPTEVALLQWLGKNGGDAGALRSEYAVADRLPFSSDRKFMASLVKGNGQTLLLVKGAPEVVLPLCSIDPQKRSAIEHRLLGYQREGMRTLVLAMTTVEEETKLIPDCMPPLHAQALVAISDPVRPDVPKAVKDCRRAGIEVKMVTGDNQLTALQIARQIGLIDKEDNGTVTDRGIAIGGAEFAALSEQEALRYAKTLRIMSRARPQDKQRLVQLLQRQGEVVAVTGDGTNDAPALNHAHVGLSLGSGTSVAKEASDITLIDDSFRSIVRAVEWGRSLYKNIQRFIFFQLVVNVTALLLVLGGAVIGTEMPLTVTQILWVNLIMDTFAAMALASLPPSHEVLAQRPRRADEFIISRPMMRGIAFWGTVFFLFTFLYLYWLENNAVGMGVNTYELTKFFTVFVMLQWWNLFNARALGSRHSAFRHFFWGKGFVLVLAMILLGQWLIVEFGGQMFRTVPLPPSDWLQIVLLTMPVMLAGELYRMAQRLKRE